MLTEDRLINSRRLGKPNGPNDIANYLKPPIKGKERRLSRHFTQKTLLPNNLS